MPKGGGSKGEPAGVFGLSSCNYGVPIMTCGKPSIGLPNRGTVTAPARLPCFVADQEWLAAKCHAEGGDPSRDHPWTIKTASMDERMNPLGSVACGTMAIVAMPV